MATLTAKTREALAKKYLETLVENVEEAHVRIKPYVHKTALCHSLWLSDEGLKTSVYFKMGKLI